jgi:hypothetical protein
MIFLAVVACTLACAALVDGISTVHFLEHTTYVEIDPVMVFIFGTNRPTPTTVYLRGGLVIVAEIGIAFGLSHLWYPLAIILGIGGLGQAAFHVYAAIKNFEL